MGLKGEQTARGVGVKPGVCGKGLSGWLSSSLGVQPARANAARVSKIGSRIRAPTLAGRTFRPNLILSAFSQNRKKCGRGHSAVALTISRAKIRKRHA